MCNYLIIYLWNCCRIFSQIHWCDFLRFQQIHLSANSFQTVVGSDYAIAWNKFYHTLYKLRLTRIVTRVPNTSASLRKKITSSIKINKGHLLQNLEMAWSFFVHCSSTQKYLSMKFQVDTSYTEYALDKFQV